MIAATLRKEFLHHLLSGQHQKCSLTVENLIQKNVPFIVIYEDLLKKTLYKIGDLWENNKISVAEEHLASTIVEKLLNDIYPSIKNDPSVQKRIIVSCMENEYHQIGSKMVADVFEKHGWEVLYLGANTPESSLISYIETVDPDYLALSISIYFHFYSLNLLLERLRKRFPNLYIIVGGQAFDHMPEDQIISTKHIKFLKDLHQIEDHLKTI